MCTYGTHINPGKPVFRYKTELERVTRVQEKAESRNQEITRRSKSMNNPGRETKRARSKAKSTCKMSQEIRKAKSRIKSRNQAVRKRQLAAIVLSTSPVAHILPVLPPVLYSCRGSDVRSQPLWY